MLVAGRTAAKVEQVAQSLGASGGSAEAIVVDATVEADVVRLFDRAMTPGAGREPADLVAFNAGVNQKIDFRELSAETFEEFWRIGCFGGFLVGREAARRLVPLGRGTVLFTGASAQSSRQARVRALLRREGGAAHARPKHGARVRA